jgi:release factor glutamine methyltransferase
MGLRQRIALWVLKGIQKYGSKNVEVRGRSYAVSKDVFNPRFFITSRFMAKNLDVSGSDEVLDMGTGCGVQAIVAAERAKRVVATDINPEAVRFAKENIKANGFETKVSVLEGDLFAPLREGLIFDVIIFTPPYMEGIPKTPFEKALYDPKKAIARRFFKETGRYLKPYGYVQMAYSTIAKPEQALEIAHNEGWKSQLIAQKQLFFETILIYRFRL